RGAVLPRLTAEGRRVCITGALHTDFDALDVVNLAKVVFMMADIRLGIEEVGSSGDIYVFDASIALPKHFVKISPTVVKKFVMCVHEAYPAKVKEIHVINSTPFVDFLIKW
ncbi:CRAL TRIO domain containing protein, partial [Asbolus verrucosus]